MSFAIIAGHGGASLGQNGGNLNIGYDTTGADLIVLVCSFTVGATPTTANVSDNNSLTWNQGTTVTTADTSTRFFYAYGSGIGRSGHIFTITVSGSFMGAYVVACTGGKTAATPFDQETSGTGGSSSTTLTTSSLTPSEGNCLVLCSLAATAAAASVTPTNLTMLGQVAYVAGVSYSIALAYEIQTTATARSETFNWTGGYYSAASIASFKAAAGGASFMPRNNRAMLQAVNRAGTY